MRSKGIVAGLAGVSAALVAASVAAQDPAVLYQWTDADGVVRYTARLERIPRALLAQTLVMRRDAASGVAVASRWGEQPGPAMSPAADETASFPAPAGPASPDLAEVAALPPSPPRQQPEAASAYAIQLESLSLSDWVRPLDRLRLLEGRRLYRTTVEVEGQAWERLRLGFFATLEQARAARARVAPHFPDAWIDRAGSEEQATSLEGAIASTGRIATPSPGSSAYVLQLGARAAYEGLRALTRLELLERHHLYRSTVELDGETWERLRLGFFPTRESAQAVLRELGGSHPDAWVARVDPGERAGSLEAAGLLAD